MSHLVDRVVNLFHTGYQSACDHLPHHLLDHNQPSLNMMKFKDGKYQIGLDVHYFKPEEVTVKTVDNTVIVEGKHSERQDEFGTVERYFLRKYPLPGLNNKSDIETTLSNDGILTVTILPPAKVEDEDEKHQHIPIQETGLVHSALFNYNEPPARMGV